MKTESGYNELFIRFQRRLLESEAASKRKSERNVSKIKGVPSDLDESGFFRKKENRKRNTYAGIGSQLLSTKNPNNQAPLSTQASKIYPADVKVHTTPKGLVRATDSLRALRTFEECQRINANGINAFKEGKYQEAGKMFETLLDSIPERDEMNTARLFNNLGITLFKMKAYRPAAEALREALPAFRRTAKHEENPRERKRLIRSFNKKVKVLKVCEARTPRPSS